LETRSSDFQRSLGSKKSEAEHRVSGGDALTLKILIGGSAS
jgi:hypothetical protein